MPSDINKVPDPAGPGRYQLPEDYDDDEHPPRHRRLTRSLNFLDTAIGPALAAAYSNWAAKAFDIGGFFTGPMRGRHKRLSNRAEIWRLTQLEGRKHKLVAEDLGCSVAVVKLAVKEIRARLIKKIGRP
jgi:hypothetical protein